MLPPMRADDPFLDRRSEEHTSELQSRVDLVCRLLLEQKNRVECSRCRMLISSESGGGGIVSTCAHNTFTDQYIRRACDWHDPHHRNQRFFFFNAPAPTEFYTLSLHDALPI